jgi:hypothetical protein
MMLSSFGPGRPNGPVAVLKTKPSSSPVLGNDLARSGIQHGQHQKNSDQHLGTRAAIGVALIV